MGYGGMALAAARQPHPLCLLGARGVYVLGSTWRRALARQLSQYWPVPRHVHVPMEVQLWSWAGLLCV
jgi:hypothetical protein